MTHRNALLTGKFYEGFPKNFMRLIYLAKASRVVMRLVTLSIVIFILASGVFAQAEKLQLCKKKFVESSLASQAVVNTEAERSGIEEATFTLSFQRTKLDTEAEAIAQIAVIGQTLFVRLCAVDLPLPSELQEPRYSLWVYLPNYEQKFYIGDLPVTPKQSRTKRRDERHIRRGVSDSFYRFHNLPRGGVFGGLILTAEPPRYTPIPNEPLRPLLFALIGDTANSKSLD